MRLPGLIGLMVLITANVGAAGARDDQAQAAAPDGGRPALDPPADPIEADRLPISIERIQKKLATAPRTTEKTGLKLEYYIEVYGTAPKLDLFTDFDLRAGPVPFVPPTHQDFLDVVTPQGFRTPAMDLNALAAWLAQRLGSKTPP